MLTAIVILSIIAAMVMPVIAGASDAYARATATRRTAERAAYAMERIVRMLRDVPEGASHGTVGISLAQASRVRFTDNRELELTGGSLYQTDASGHRVVLCAGVDALTIGYLAQDGVTSTLASPSTTQRFNVSITVGGFDLRTAAMARVRVVNPS
jgi:type II secretory pathway pseudopilin PulG